jgi:hypothetical protein
MVNQANQWKQKKGMVNWVLTTFRPAQAPIDHKLSLELRQGVVLFCAFYGLFAFVQ